MQLALLVVCGGDGRNRSSTHSKGPGSDSGMPIADAQRAFQISIWSTQWDRYEFILKVLFTGMRNYYCNISHSIINNN